MAHVNKVNVKNWQGAEALELGIVAYTYNPSTQEKEQDDFKSKAAWAHNTAYLKTIIDSSQDFHKRLLQRQTGKSVCYA